MKNLSLKTDVRYVGPDCMSSSVQMQSNAVVYIFLDKCAME